MLTPNQSRLLTEMWTNAQAAPAPYRADGHWERMAQEFEGWFEEQGIGLVEDQPYNNCYASHVPGHPAYYEFACRLLHRELVRRDRWEVMSRYDAVKSALPETSPRRVVINGVPLSWDMLISLDSLLTIAEFHPRILTSACVVGDLGAGWGRFGFVLKQINPLCSYVVFDLPESLLVSSTYLTRILPAERFHYLVRDWSALPDGGIWFVGADALEDFRQNRLDCLVSIASFQEMPSDMVEKYFNIIDATARTFYTLQSRGRNYHIKKNWQEQVLRPVSWSGRYFEAVYNLL